MKHHYVISPIKVEIEGNSVHYPANVIIHDADGDTVVLQMPIARYPNEGPDSIDAVITTGALAKALYGHAERVRDQEKTDREWFDKSLSVVPVDKPKPGLSAAVINALVKLVMAEAPQDSEGGITAVAKRYVNTLNTDDCVAIGKYFGKNPQEAADGPR